MKDFIKKVYINSPFLLKEVFANIEALRRNYYRRSGEYKKYYYDIQISKMLNQYNFKNQINKFNKLLKYANTQVKYYQDNVGVKHIDTIEDINNIPLTSKNLMKKNIGQFINNNQENKLWKGETSGSTGNPFNHYRDPKSMQYEYALYDKLYDFFLKGSKKYNRARISGVNIVKAECKKPPYWFFIKVFNQLQCSAYHIDSSTYRYYIAAFNKYKVELGTGYAKAWLFLAQYMNENNLKFLNMKGIVTDSEGLSDQEKYEIEKAFNCPVYQTYGLSEVGMLAVQCKYNHYHIFSDRCYIEIVDENGNSLSDGEIGEIAVTDLQSYDAPYIRYKTGDMGALIHSECECGWKSPYIKELSGRLDDYVLTVDGRKIGRLSHIAKPAQGIVGMQLIQHQPGKLKIHVLPAKNFDVGSMDDVIKIAKEYLGDMNISWELVNELEKNKSGKVRYVIRKI